MIWCRCCLGGTNLVTACLDSRSFYSCYCLSIPAIVWKDIAPVLAARGFRVLLYGIFTQPLSLILTYLSIPKISTGEVTLTRLKLPTIQIFIPHNLPILCNILDGRKQILSVSQWYVCIPIFSTQLIIKILGWCHCCGIHFTLSPPC